MMAAPAFSLKPLLTLLGLIAIAHLPLGAQADTSFIIPSIISALIFIWSIYEPDNVKPWMIFTLGLVADVISSGPIGFWSLYYLSFQAIAFWFGRNPTNSGLLLNWIGYLIASVIVTFLGWLVTTLYTMQSADWHPMLVGAGVVSMGFPLIYWVSGVARRAPPASSNSALLDEIS